MAPTYQLAIKEVFDGLSARQKRYAHHLARAAWHGSRIVLRQTSPESEGIYDFILLLYKSCNGKWTTFVDEYDVEHKDVAAFLEYAAQFLAHLGNYYGAGDRKAVPHLTSGTLRKMAGISPETTSALERIIDPMFSDLPNTLGYPGKTTQSAYYLGDEDITKEEIATVAAVMEKHLIEPENTRICKKIEGGTSIFDILQASANISSPRKLDSDSRAVFNVRSGDHCAELSKVCKELREAAKHTSNEIQYHLMQKYLVFFGVGDMRSFFNAQKSWVTDSSPRVEHIIGFMESYRDPYGVRCEWESMVSISDPTETSKLEGLVQGATKFIRMLPWAVPGENDGKGPFEPRFFDPPNFTIVHALAFCNSTVWDGCNLPNYNDIREAYGAKNIVFSNRLAIKGEATPLSRFVHPSEAEPLKIYSGIVHFIKNAIHELLGHGTGKLLSETAPGVYNFDIDNPPKSPLTGKPIKTWYKLGKAWKSVFSDLSNTVEECRATLVSYYLPDDKDILALFGIDDSTADELIYYLYLTIGVLGLEALGSFNGETKSWGDQHHRGDFAIFKHLLLDGNGVMKVDYSRSARTVHVRVDRSKLISHGKPALGRLVLCLHLWRCTADIDACRTFYEPLTSVDQEYEDWRQVVISSSAGQEPSHVKVDPGGKIVQPNTILRDDGSVDLKVYDESSEGIIQSFVEREV